MPDVTPLEIDLLLLFYTFSDQFGKVDIQAANTWAKKKFGITLQDVPFTLEQQHLDLLMDSEVLYDIRPIINKIK